MKIKNFFKRRWETLILIVMTGYDSFLHFFELVMGYYPNFSYFSTRLGYTTFWAIYWAIAFLLAIKILIKKRK